jgi:2-polyprenyl-3-methyl-5-hydroxy-6-metoxy-1,4-benzoquinol methylase
MESAEMASIATIYAEKPAAYFGGARLDIVALLNTNSKSAILELGCGMGGTGAAALAAGKAGRYVGIELDKSAAAVASATLSDVLVGDVTSMDLHAFDGTFDALIISEVLEHLTDPWTTLGRLVACLKPGGVVFASSPNVSHRRIVMRLLKGQFDYTEDGAMDRTHLRWFTPRTFQRMFEDAGIEITHIGPLVPMRWKARLIDQMTAGCLRHLFMPQIMVSGVRRYPFP